MTATMVETAVFSASLKARFCLIEVTRSMCSWK